MNNRVKDFDFFFKRKPGPVSSFDKPYIIAIFEILIIAKSLSKYSTLFIGSRKTVVLQCTSEMHSYISCGWTTVSICAMIVKYACIYSCKISVLIELILKKTLKKD